MQKKRRREGTTAKHPARLSMYYGTQVVAAVDLGCLAVFTVELMVKVGALDFSPAEYLRDAWNRFDALIVFK